LAGIDQPKVSNGTGDNSVEHRGTRESDAQLSNVSTAGTPCCVQRILGIVDRLPCMGQKSLAGIGEKHATRSALQQYCPGGSVFGGNQHPTVIRSREIALRVSATANIHNVAVEGRQEAAFRTSPAPPPRTFGFENGKFRERHGGERGLDAWSGQHRDAWS
jgi:hypothetical protein